jgi:DNA polymerase-1
MVLSIVETLKPDYVVAAFDLPKPTHRHEAYKEYKAGRLKTDGALVEQIKRARDVLGALSIPTYDREGFEADDILGTIVENEKNNSDLEIIIATGDADAFQLVSGNKVQVFTMRKGVKDVVLYDEAAVVERYGFIPTLLPDYKGLRGDPSDNIIGIKGIGEKTATILIKEFGTIESMYEALKKSEERFKTAGITPRVIGLLRDGEEEALFSKTLATIRRDAPIEWSLPEKRWVETISVDEAGALFMQLEFRAMKSRLESALKKVSGGSVITAFAVEPAKTVNEISEQELKELCVALWVFDSNITNPNTEDILSFANTKTLREAQPLVLEALTRRNAVRIFEDIEKPLIPVVSAMEKHGVLIDKTFLQELGVTYRAELEKLEKSIYIHAGCEFNVASPKQLGEVLFSKMGLKVARQKKTAGGALSTKESELEKMRDLHPIIGEILQFRELAKLLGTYIEAIPPLLDGGDRLHARFIQTGTVTGRMASENPNLQNIPNKTNLGRAIRKAFIAPKGRVLLSLDYSQIELRIAAFLSKDPSFIEIFTSGQDVHTAVAAKVFNVSIDDVTKEMRSRAKVINFGILYGMGTLALKQNLNSSREEAQTFMDEYFARFPELAGYLNRTKEEAGRLGYTETYFGRRRYFEGLKSHLSFVKATAERMAINAPIQGTCADMVKIAMRRINECIQERFTHKADLVLQVHDELVYEVDKDISVECSCAFKSIMESVIPAKDISGIVCVAEARVGTSWEDMEKVK